MNGSLIVRHIYDVYWFIGCAVCGLLTGRLFVWLFNRLPASWLCDYGEEPGPELEAPRLYRRPDALKFGLLFSAAFLLLYLQYGGKNLYFFTCCAAVVLLAVVAVSDAKYGVIPDQFTLMLLAPGVAVAAWELLGGGGIFFLKSYSPFAGALLGGALYLLLGFLGKLFYRKESIGMGDVKLFAVLGFFCGFPQVVFVFLLTIVLAGFHFILLMLFKKLEKDSYLPLGPYICLAFYLYLAFRWQLNYLVGWYAAMLL